VGAENVRALFRTQGGRVISSLHRELQETCALPGYCSTFSGNSLPTFRDLSLESSGVKNPEMKVSKEDKDFLAPEVGRLGCPEIILRRAISQKNADLKRRTSWNA
jgi:hypothetical protein